MNKVRAILDADFVGTFGGSSLDPFHGPTDVMFLAATNPDQDGLFAAFTGADARRNVALTVPVSIGPRVRVAGWNVTSFFPASSKSIVRSVGPQFVTRRHNAAGAPAQTWLTTQPAFCGIQQGGGILHPQLGAIFGICSGICIDVGIFRAEKSRPWAWLVSEFKSWTLRLALCSRRLVQLVIGLLQQIARALDGVASGCTCHLRPSFLLSRWRGVSGPGDGSAAFALTRT